MMSTVSADRSDAIEGEAIIESSGYESIDLLTETGTPVEVWVDVIGNDSASNSSILSHPEIMRYLNPRKENIILNQISPFL